jgi:hypothetical protein
MSKLFDEFCQQGTRLAGNVHGNVKNELLGLDNIPQ